MRKGRDGEKREKNGEKKRGKKEKIRMKIVATTSLPAVDRPNADRWNAARSRQKCKMSKGWGGEGSALKIKKSTNQNVEFLTRRGVCILGFVPNVIVDLKCFI